MGRGMAVPTSIPSFVTYPDVQFAVLPPGIHDASVADIEGRFVTSLSPNPRRLAVYTGWRQFRDVLRSLLPIASEYIDGSFITGKPHPKDVDVSFWVAADDLNALSSTAMNGLNALWASGSSYHVDAYIVPECPPGHPQHGDFKHMLWTEDYWSRTRDLAGLPHPAHGPRKGYVRVVGP